MADEFRVHRNVDELHRLFGHSPAPAGGGGDVSAAAGTGFKDACVEELNKDRTPFVSTQV